MTSHWRGVQRRLHLALVQSMRTPPGELLQLKHESTQVVRRAPLLSSVYGWIIDRKRTRETRAASRIVPQEIPVLSVGNYTFGATGKTPFVMFLADFVLRVRKGEGRVPLLLTRGYGDDEWRMFCSRFPDCIAAVGSDRLALGIEYTSKFSSRLSCVLLEDGLQQWKIHKDLEIVMVDALAPFGNGNLIPHGSLRELPQDALRRADVVVLHHSNLVRDRRILEQTLQEIKLLVDQTRQPIIAQSGVAVTALPTLQEYDSQDRDAATSWSEFEGKTAIVFCGVGNPDSVGKVIEGMGVWSRVVLEAYPDHHAFSLDDLCDVHNRVDAIAAEYGLAPTDIVLLTTEKDAARSSAEILTIYGELYDVRVMVTELKLLVGEEDVLNRVKNTIHAW